MRKLSRFLAALAAPLLAGVGLAEDGAIRLLPADAQVTSVNQQLADDLAMTMRKSGRLAQYSISITAEGGIVTLAGTVENSQQRAEALNLARRFPGVVGVDNQLQTRVEDKLVVVTFQEAAANATQAPAGSGALPVHNAATGSKAPALEPAPMNAFPGGVAPYSDSPVLPPYAWPAYTPYNNYASMAYQTQYPSGAWPFIGPPHPYPMIPSGWRSVTLRWRRGYWWLRFNAF
jgi:hypothetical protein